MEQQNEKIDGEATLKELKQKFAQKVEALMQSPRIPQSVKEILVKELTNSEFSESVK